MYLDNLLIVVEQSSEDGKAYDYDIRHMEGPLRSSSLVDNIDILYYGDYTPNCDEALLSYCSQKNPQAILLSLQNLSMRRGGAPTPESIRKVTHDLQIPTVLFWFDIYADAVSEVLERYAHSATMNVILGADASSHKALQHVGTDFVYTGATFDERLFDIPEDVRDIPVGFLGNFKRTRGEWITRLEKQGIPVHIAGGRLGESKRMSYDEYLKLMSRLKIALNFSVLSQNQIVFESDKGYLRNRLDWLGRIVGSWPRELVRHPSKIRKALPILRGTARSLSGSLKTPRHMLRAREFEAMWCRAFLLDENNPVTRRYFEPYVDYVPFTSLNDLVDKIRYYLENDGERDRIRMQGRATMEKYYSARLYWETLFETVGLVSGRQGMRQPGEIWNKAFFDARRSDASFGNTKGGIGQQERE